MYRVLRVIFFAKKATPYSRKRAGFLAREPREAATRIRGAAGVTQARLHTGRHRGCSRWIATRAASAAKSAQREDSRGSGSLWPSG